MTFFVGEPHERNCYRTDKPCAACSTADPVRAACHAMHYFLNAVVFAVDAGRATAMALQHPDPIYGPVTWCDHLVPTDWCAAHWAYPRHPVAYLQGSARWRLDIKKGPEGPDGYAF